MKKTVLFGMMFGLFLTANAQNPVRWEYSCRKIMANTYEIKLVAKVNAPWHIYSQFMDKGGPLPTKISFMKNPVVTLMGKIKEEGRIVSKYEDVFDIKVKYFNGNATFIQLVKTRPAVKTNLEAIVEYMACNDAQCLNPVTEKLLIVLK